MVTVTRGPRAVGQTAIVRAGHPMESFDLPAEFITDIVPAILDMLDSNRNDSVDFVVDGETYTVFVDSYVPPPRLVIVGATQAAQSLTRMAKELGYRVIVNDARSAFATPERFPEADEVVKGWPQDVLPKLKMDDSTYVVLLSHDPKFDEPTLQHILPLPVRYIGAIGSKKTQEERRRRLVDQGFQPDQVARIHGPVGLDLGGKGPAEIALAILAEMTAVRYGRSK